jgi:lysozyme
MKVSNIDLIKESEGLVLKAYLPTANDVWTIGYGHTKGVKPGQIITKETAEKYLREDLVWVEAVIDKWIKVSINQNQYDALASLIFNIGESQFIGSSVLRWLNAGNITQAADSFVLWNKQRNKTSGKLEVLNGLTKRRQKEKELFLK